MDQDIKTHKNITTKHTAHTAVKRKERKSEHKEGYKEPERHKEHKKDIREEHKDIKKISIWEKLPVYLIIAVAAIILFNQLQISSISKSVNSLSYGTGLATLGLSGKDKNLDKVDVTQIKSTAQAIAALYPIDKIKTTEDAIAIMIPTGTPDYGQAMGVSFDDPVNSMNSMARAYPALKQQAQQNPQIWQRYLNLAAAPRGISCEFCCGVGPQGIDAKGNLLCGCQHLPAIHTVTLWLMLNTDYSDAQILKEVMKWKTIFFPKNMVGLASQIAGGDASVLEDLPGMVGGC